MAVFHESLGQAIDTLHRGGTNLGVVVVHVTENEKGTNTKAGAQQEILRTCDALGLHAWFMQMNIFGGAATQQDLLSLVAKERRHELLNTGNNVFQGSTLAEELGSRKITSIVVMGEELRSCIRMSIISRDGDKQGKAALDLGFTVLTSPLVLRAGAAHDMSWPAEISALAIDQPKLLWYTKL